MQERKELANLPDSALRDIGVERIAAINESNRKANDLPLERLRDVYDQY